MPNVNKASTAAYVDANYVYYRWPPQKPPCGC